MEEPAIGGKARREQSLLLVGCQRRADGRFLVAPRDVVVNEPAPEPRAFEYLAEHRQFAVNCFWCPTLIRARILVCGKLRRRDLSQLALREESGERFGVLQPSTCIAAVQSVPIGPGLSEACGLPCLKLAFGAARNSRIVGAVRVGSLQRLSLAVAVEPSLDAVLQRLVGGLAGEALALTRVWLLEAGDVCATCPLREECADRTRGLHLAASAGRSLDGTEDWSRLTGDFKRIPLKARKVGYIAATASSVLLREIAEEQQWKPRAGWVVRESIRCCAGHPLVFRGETLGAGCLLSNGH